MKSNLIKGFILGLGITFLSSGVAFAATEEIKAGVSAPEIAITGETAGKPISGEITAVEAVPPDAVIMGGSGSSGYAGDSVSVSMEQPDETTLKKQSEIDQYLFEQHKDEIAEKGIFVTHTAPIGKIVEIGIDPYTDANAAYLYDIFGKDNIKIVEGHRAQIYDMPAATSGKDAPVSANVSNQVADDQVIGAPVAPVSEDVRTTSAAGSEEIAMIKADNKLPMTLIYSLGGLMVLGIIVLVARRQAVAAKK